MFAHMHEAACCLTSGLCGLTQLFKGCAHSFVFRLTLAFGKLVKVRLRLQAEYRVAGSNLLPVNSTLAGACGTALYNVLVRQQATLADACMQRQSACLRRCKARKSPVSCACLRQQRVRGASHAGQLLSSSPSHYADKRTVSPCAERRELPEHADLLRGFAGELLSYHRAYLCGEQTNILMLPTQQARQECVVKGANTTEAAAAAVYSAPQRAGVS